MAQILTVSDYQLALESCIECGVMAPLQAAQKYAGMLSRQTREGRLSRESADAELLHAKQRFYEKAVGYI